jgi:hypothetical protein
MLFYNGHVQFLTREAECRQNASGICIHPEDRKKTGNSSVLWNYLTWWALGVVCVYSNPRV